MKLHQPYFRLWWFYTLGAVLFVVPSVFAFCIAATTGRTIGDIVGHTSASMPELVGCLLALVASLLLPIAASAWVPPAHSDQIRRHCRYLASRAADRLLLGVLFVNVVATLTWNVGSLVQDASAGSRWAFVLSLFPLSLFFLLYYVQGLRTIRRSAVWWANVVLFAGVNLMRGWTGQLLLLAFWFLVHTRPRPRILLVTAVTAFVGFVYLYPLLDAYKLVTRGVISQVTDASAESSLFYLEKLMGRLSPFSNAIYIQTRAEEVASMVAAESGELDFVRDFVLGVVPKKLLGYENFATYNQILNSIDAGSWVTVSSFNVPFPARLDSYLSVDAGRAMLFACMIIALVASSTWMLKRTFGQLGACVAIYVNCELLYSTNMLAYGYTMLMIVLVCAGARLLAPAARGRRVRHGPSGAGPRRCPPA